MNPRIQLAALGCLMATLVTIDACKSKGQEQSTAGSRAVGTSVAALRPSATPPGKAPCPANGRWSDCAVFNGLDRAGLAPRRDSAAGAVRVQPLQQSGTRLLLGGAELDVFIYPDVASRERDEARLDRSKYIEATDEPTLRGEATLIRNTNLLAILHSRNDHQRERVSDALTVGPPQPSRVTPSSNRPAPR